MPEPDTALLHEWLLRAAAATPCAIALEEEERRTSFQELVASAWAIAATLRARGVRPGDRVALLLPKTTEAVVAVFGCLLAGAVYVPIHPRWPADRVALVVEDCGARLVFEVAEGGVRLRDVCAPAESAQGVPSGPVPAVPRLVSAPVRERDTVSNASVGMSADAAGTSARATSQRERL